MQHLQAFKVHGHPQHSPAAAGEPWELPCAGFGTGRVTAEVFWSREVGQMTPSGPDPIHDSGNVEVMPQGEGWRLLLLTAHTSFISKLCCFTERLSVLSCSGVRRPEASLAK